MADEGETINNDNQFLLEVNERENDVKLLLSKKDKKNALYKSLDNPPINAKSQQIKV